MKTKKLITLALAGLMTTATTGIGSADAKENPERNAYFGDTHGHSSLSSDAFGFGNRLMPDNAYKLARGDEAKLVHTEQQAQKFEAVILPYGEMQAQ